MKWLRQMPSVILLVALTIVYIMCGYMIGYHQGYQSGQKDYVGYLNNVLDATPETKK